MRIWRAGKRPQSTTEELPELVYTQNGFEHYLGKIDPKKAQVSINGWIINPDQAIEEIRVFFQKNRH